MAVSRHDSYPELSFKSSKAFEKWMNTHHSKSDGIWLRIAKANTGIQSVSHKEALDVSLCYGWIDGLRRGLDENYFLQKYTPRRPNSIWSVVNQKKVELLIREKKMQSAGLAAIEVAKNNGQWQKAYHSQSAITIPADLQLALDEHPRAKAFFKTLSSQNRYAILFRTGQVKRPETRKKKIGEYIAMLEKQQTIYPQ